MGPLNGIRILEVGGIGPIPFVGMMLSDMGAEIIRVEKMPSRTESAADIPAGILERNRKRIAIDLKSPAGVDAILRLVEQCDVLIEGFRPGVMERLGLGPEVCQARNGRLIFGRMTGWGQTGPLARTAGHDLNYISTVGITSTIGSADRRPMPPLNLTGDYGGGAMLLTVGVCAALYERSVSGRGQVIDAAMCDGAALLMNTIYELMQRGQWSDRRESNMMDGGAHFYGTYETADGQYMAVAAAEPQFYRQLLVELGLDGDEELASHQMDPARWPDFRDRLAAAFKTRTRAEWTERMLHKDTCTVPVLNLREALAFPHNRDRGMFIHVDGLDQAAPAPRFDRTPQDMPVPASAVGLHSDDILALAGFSATEAGALKASGVVI